MSDDCSLEAGIDPLWGAGCWVGRLTTPNLESRYVFLSPGDGFPARGGQCHMDWLDRIVRQTLWDNFFPWLMAMAAGRPMPPAVDDPGGRCA